MPCGFSSHSLFCLYVVAFLWLVVVEFAVGVDNFAASVISIVFVVNVAASVMPSCLCGYVC